MMRTLLTLIATLALLLAPSALAQENESADGVEEGEQAWVDDCPPDMMCAMEQPAEEEPAKEELGNETYDEPTYSGDCGGEVCAYEGAPGSMGPEDCIECTQAPVDPQDDDYVKAPEGSEGGITSAPEDAESQSESAKTVPAPALALGILALAGAAVLGLVARRS